ncbi:endonuclease/exonuclease/phosphatase family protein, partial [Nocardioides sp.]|uniref:endonuclease/exonuclease/phosphatase family protein n=1 Tax=Nocardioides sp. TaxID=35761 RepID=UPI002723CD74
MRIVSLNAWGGALYDDLAAWLPGVDPDVLCVQEALRTPDLRGWTRFDDGDHVLPQRADLVADLAELLPAHEVTFVVSDSGPVTDADGHEHRQDFGVATLVRDTLPVVAHRTTFVHGQYVDHAAWPTGDRPRAAHAV